MVKVNEMQKVNLEVKAIGKGYKPTTAYMQVKFDGNPTLYDYTRKYNEDDQGNYFSIVSGCRVTFDKEFKLLGITREYNVAGVKKRSTSNQVKSTTVIKEKPVCNHTTPQIVTESNNSKEVRHEKYDTIKTCLISDIPIYLAGPAGSGKNFTVEQIAKELGWNFYFSNSVQQEYKLTGFIDAGGDYHETEFYKACTDTQDCIFFLDEIDASIPEVLVLLNAAIANGYFEFPTGKVNLEHIHFIAAGNTVGSGADELYTGRMVIDQATLDRFAIIDFDYSKNIELSISNQNSDLIEFIHSLRDEANLNGIRATFSYRCIIMVTKLEKANMPLNEILKISVFKGLDKDTINTFRIKGSSKYQKALSEIQAA